MHLMDPIKVHVIYTRSTVRMQTLYVIGRYIVQFLVIYNCDLRKWSEEIRLSSDHDSTASEGGY